MLQQKQKIKEVPTELFKFLFQVFIEAPSTVRGEIATVVADTGHWNFSNCIMIQFAMEFEVYLNPQNLNETTSIVVSSRYYWQLFFRNESMKLSTGIRPEYILSQTNTSLKFNRFPHQPK